MPNALPISDIVTVAISVAPSAPQAKSFGCALILGINTNLPLYDRVRTYTNLAGVAVDFATNTDEYKAAAAYFGQNPAPASVKIGRKFTTAQSGVLRGGPNVDQTLGDYTAITNGGFDITINGVLKQLTGINLSGAANLAAVAADLQTALAAAVSGTTCSYDATTKRFIVTIAGTTGTGSTVSFAAPPTSSGPPTDLSALLQLTNVTGASVNQGIAIETVTAAWTASLAWDQGWYGMIITGTTAQDSKDSMAFAQSNGLLFFDATADANVEDGTQTSDLAYYNKNQAYDKALVLFDNVNSDKFICASAIAKMLAVDYTQPNSFITLWGKSAPGYAPVIITETQRAAIEGKNGNYLGSFGSQSSATSMFMTGKVGSGRFVDEVIGLDWLANLMQTAVFAEMIGATSKIPQTDAGAARLVKALQIALAQARTAGLLAPGYWTGPDTGEVKNGSFLQTGYYVFAAPVSSQSASDRAARKAPALTAIGIGAGAIQSAAVGFTFQR